MARRPDLPQALATLLAKLEPEMAEIVLDAFQAMRDGVDMDGLIAALERNDIDGALAAIGIDPGDFSTYTLGRTQAFLEAGKLESSYIPTDEANSVKFVFDLSNPRAERWIKTEAATRITGYVSEQIDAARDVISAGFSRGDGPAQIAVDIAGRMDRATGRRQGGIVGLSQPQAGYVESMRQRLLSGDPAEMKKVLGGMSLRDKRYDATIMRHIEAGTPLSRADVDKLTGRYADRLLRRRAEDIARTETQQSVFGARAESYRQALEREGLPGEALEKEWRHRGSLDDARVQHLAMDNKTVTGIDTPFFLFDGTAMLFAHDPAGGVKHNANCRCDTWFRILFGYRRDL